MSVPFSPADLVRWTGGELLRGPADAVFTGTCIDTRAVTAGDLFVAIVGPNHDAHSFLSQAALAGASGLLVEAGRELDASLPPSLPVIAVPDTTVALGTAAAGHRAGFDGTVVAITGSSGKTTTKEMCAAILAVDAPCLKTEGNLNNQFGLPLTLFRRRPEHRTAVVEVGTNHAGEIAQLAAIARPDVSLITNVGTAHIEYLESREGIAKEKGALFEALGEDGIAVVNADDPLVVEQSRRAPGRTLRFGLREDADVRGERVEFTDGGSFDFHLRTPWGEAGINVIGLGETTVQNALAAAATALSAGAPVENVRVGLGRYRAVSGRMAHLALPDGVHLIDDTYNANPQSMQAALESLAALATTGRGFAVLGDMGELGHTEERAHQDAGRLAAELGIHSVLAVGRQAENVVAAAVEAGLEPARASAFKEHEPLILRLREQLQPGDWVLVKGSRAMRMERIVQTLAREENT